MTAVHYEAERLTILRGDAAAIDLPDHSVDLIVTSPPYFGLRSYQDGGEHYTGQIGDEATPAEFVAALVACTRDWVRLLKPSGSIWVNLGDKYSRGMRPKGQADQFRDGADITYLDPRYVKDMTPEDCGVAGKSLIGVPWRYALACIDDLGLILRAEVIWSKPNGLPESVTDRVRRSHEQWFHFTVQPRYFSAVDEVREASKEAAHHARYAEASKGYHNRYAVDTRHGASDASMLGCNPLGKLPGSVWEIPTQPLRVPDHLCVDHFAAFPMEFPRRIIRGWSPAGVCTACGEGRRPLVLTDLGRKERDTPAYGAGNHGTGGSTLGSRGTSAVITGYACDCPDTSAPTTPAVVLDPFGGTGTTALVAWSLGRHGISNDLSADYCRLAQWRTTDPGERARALQVEKPAPQIDGQLAML